MELWPKLIGQLLLPPASLILLLLAGLLIHIKWRLAGTLIMTAATLTLYGLSLPLTGQQLLAGLEQPYHDPPANTDAQSPPQAIVVLGGGRYTDAPEYQGDTVSQATLVRLRYAARLHRQTGLPILVSAGTPHHEKISEAALMAAVLEQEYGITPLWRDEVSGNTMENALQSQAILAGEGIRRVYVVTHGWHMTRALWAFTRAGLIPTPAATQFSTLDAGDRRGLGYFPGADGLHMSSTALHEHLGMAWYRLKYATPTPAEPTVPQP